MGIFGEIHYLFILIKTFICQASLFGVGSREGGISSSDYERFLKSFARKETGKTDELQEGAAESIYFFQKWKIFYLCLLGEQFHREEKFVTQEREKERELEKLCS